MDKSGSRSSRRSRSILGVRAPHMFRYVAAALLLVLWTATASGQNLHIYHDAHGNIYIDPGVGRDPPPLFENLTPDGDHPDTTWAVSPGVEEGQHHAAPLRVTASASSATSNYPAEVGRSRPGNAPSGICSLPRPAQLLSPREARTFDHIVADATSAAVRRNEEGPSRKELALELVLLLEHGLARLEPLSSRAPR
jgi:hypothetical protein